MIDHMMTDKTWSMHEVRLAFREGWMMTVGGIRAERVNMPCWPSDNECIEHIAKCADEGSEFHQRALVRHTKLRMTTIP